MVDYTYPTGNGGIMLVRDSGYLVDFYVQSGLSATFGSNLPWNGYVNGVTIGGTFSYSTGRPWVLVASYGVSYNQWIRFSLGNTGTEGLGGPTDMYVSISRASVPAPPIPVAINPANVGHTQFVYEFNANGDGGAPIVESQIGYGYSESHVQFYMSSGGTSLIQNLAVGSTVYAWSRCRNYVGWGGWSVRTTVTLLPGGWVKVNGVWMPAIPFVKKSGVWVAAIPYIKKAGVWSLAKGS